MDTRNAAVTPESKVIPVRGYSLVIDIGWPEVAETVVFIGQHLLSRTGP